MTRARFEIIPTDDIGERAARAFPDPSTVTLTVTSLPKHGTERTVDSALALASRGFRVVPHLAARNLGGRSDLERTLGRLGDAGIDEAFVISGDATSAVGAYSTSLELIRDAVEIAPGLALDIAGYPEGHPHPRTRASSGTCSSARPSSAASSPRCASTSTRWCATPTACAAAASPPGSGPGCPGRWSARGS
ncbi:hypothetical protein Q0F99_13510 [Rathayibacter oskolensis]|uniref:hypothetical protein n=1 Tax=Rathayibacter oskolensis TaxID=1891671 RepID=UPI00265E4575|nr:hypothetical protein [Rathayibacter oskolensis]WKK70784.1 hypothetical protein Q0F99_13510 [Rathayibacter oskolensis]